MQHVNSLQNLTHAALDDLQRAFLECPHAPTEGLILSALVMVKQVHDSLLDRKDTCPDHEPEEYCCGV